MNCDEVPLIELLRAESGSSETEEALAHIEGCPTCQERLQTMAAVQALYREQPQSQRNRFRFWLLAAGLLIALLVPIVYPIWHSSSPEIGDLASLATREKYPYFPLQTRSPSQRSEVEARQKAFAAYGAARFSQASEWFAKLTPSADILFYNGVTHYLLEEYPEALSNLTRAVELDIRWEGAALWYEANIYLKTEHKGRAQERLKELVDKAHNEYQQKTIKLLKELETW